MIGRYPDGRDARRAEATAALRAMAVKVAAYEGLDARWIFPLGYSVAATRGASEAPNGERADVGLGAAKRFVTLCFASDLLADPRVLAAYAQRFTAHRRRDARDLRAAHGPSPAGATLIALVSSSASMENSRPT